MRYGRTAPARACRAGLQGRRTWTGRSCAPAWSCARVGRDGGDAAGECIVRHAVRRVAARDRCCQRQRGLRAGRGGSRCASARAARGAGRRDLRAGRGNRPMTVHFIGAGPGAADLITLRGRDILARCPVCLYAGSIVPRALLAHCPPDALLIDTAPLDLDAIERACLDAHARGQDVARLHSGDLSIYSAVAEQVRRLERHGVKCSFTPGVPAFAAAAAALGRELTVPTVAQSVVLTRVPGRASAMPARETLGAYAATGATLAIHLSAALLDRAVATLLPHYGVDCPAVLAVRVSWPDEQLIRSRLGTVLEAAKGVERTALLLVGPALAAEDFSE